MCLFVRLSACAFRLFEYLLDCLFPCLVCLYVRGCLFDVCVNAAAVLVFFVCLVCWLHSLSVWLCVSVLELFVCFVWVNAVVWLLVCVFLCVLLR